MTIEPFTNTYIEVHTYKSGVIGVHWKGGNHEIIFWQGGKNEAWADEKAERLQASLIEYPEIIHTRWDDKK